MLRLRSIRLLAGASALAVISAMAFAWPARAVPDPFSLTSGFLDTGPISPRAIAAIDTSKLQLDLTPIFEPPAEGIGTDALIDEIRDLLNPPAIIRVDRFPFIGKLEFEGLSGNERAIGNALQNIYELGNGEGGGYGPDFAALFEYLGGLGPGDEGLVRGVLKELGGAELAQLQNTTLGLTLPFSALLGQRLDSAKLSDFASAQHIQYAEAIAVMSDASSGASSAGAGASFWARGYGQWSKLDGDAEAPGYDQSTGGAAAGVDFPVGRRGLLGIAVGWSTTDVDFATPGDNADIDSFQVGGYGSYGFGRCYVDAQVVGAFHDLSTTRVLNLPTPPGGMVAGANYDARSFLASAEFGTLWREGNWLIQPHVGLMYAHVDSDAFIESGGGDFNLIVKKSSADSVASTVGLRVATQIKVGNTVIIPEVSAAWRHDFDDDRQTFTAAFPADPTSTFKIVASDVAQDSALIGAGLTATVAKNVDVFLNYKGLINQDIDVHNISAGFRITW